VELVGILRMPNCKLSAGGGAAVGGKIENFKMEGKARELFPQSGISDRAIIRLWC